MKITPQIWAALAVTLVALFLASGYMFGGVAAYPVPREELLVPPREDAAIRRSELVFDALVSGAAGPRERNPFNLQAQTRVLGVSIPLPPPPPLTLPAPPALPLSGGER